MKRLIFVVGASVVVTLLALYFVGSVAARPGGMMGIHPQASGNGSLISLADARTRAEQYLTENQYDGLKVGHVMQFSNQFDAEVLNETGSGAFELLISLDGQGVYPEPQSMMWNTAYSLMDAMTGGQQGMMGSSAGMSGMMGTGAGVSGMMGAGAMASSHMGTTMAQGHGMMGSGQGSMMNGSQSNGMGCGAAMGYHPETAQQLTTPLSTADAVQQAQAWLDQNRLGVTASNSTAFPGYVTVDLEQGGKTVGMLSVQTSTSTIWEHVWHGDFVATDTAS